MIGTGAMTMMIGATIAAAIIAMTGMTAVVGIKAARDMTNARKESRTTGETETITTGGGATSLNALSVKAATMSAAEIEAANRAEAGILGMTTAFGTGPAQTPGMVGLLPKGRTPTTRS
jgi:sRNA-binding carbon storage regulator CsrA